MRKITGVFAAAAICAIGASASTSQAQSSGSQRADRLFERMDANSDGVITFEEVAKLRAAAFDRLDNDADGFLTLTEAQVAQSEMQTRGRDSSGRGRSRPSQDLNQLDTNDDGLISREEFSSEIGRLAQLDENGDGAISRAEVDEMMSRMGRRRR